jgi:large subunit ribosomal protein L41e
MRFLMNLGSMEYVFSSTLNILSYHNIYKRTRNLCSQMKRSSRRWKKKRQMRWKWQRKRMKKEKRKRAIRAGRH